MTKILAISLTILADAALLAPLAGCAVDEPSLGGLECGYREAELSPLRYDGSGVCYLLVGDGSHRFADDARSVCAGHGQRCAFFAPSDGYYGAVRVWEPVIGAGEVVRVEVPCDYDPANCPAGD